MFLITILFFLCVTAGHAAPSAKNDDDPPKINRYFKQRPENYVVFNEIGSLASSLTYLHVALPLNLTTFEDQAMLIAATLHNLSYTAADQTNYAYNLYYYPGLRKVLSDIADTLLYKLERVLDRYFILETIVPLSTPMNLVRNDRSALPPGTASFTPRPQIFSDQNPYDIKGNFVPHSPNYVFKRILLSRAEFNATNSPNLSISQLRQHNLALFDELMKYVDLAETLQRRIMELSSQPPCSPVNIFSSVRVKAQQAGKGEGFGHIDVSPFAHGPAPITTEPPTKAKSLLDQARPRKTRDIQIQVDAISPDWFEATEFLDDDGQVKDIMVKTTDDVAPEKRAAIFLIGLVLAGIMGTFLGLYNAIEMSSLKKQVADLQTQQALLIQITNNHEQQLADLAKGLAGVIDLVETLLKRNPAVLHAQLLNQIDQLEYRVNMALDVVQQLQHRRLAVNFLNHGQLESLHKQLQDMAASHDTTLLTTQISDYFQLETSYLRSGKDIIIILHVPAVHEAHLLKLYKYLSYPFPLSEPTPQKAYSIHEAVVGNTKIYDILNNNTQLVMEGLYIKPEADFIATGGKGQYKLMNTDEIALCEQHSRVILCKEHQVLRTKMEESCLGALFLRSEKATRKHCKFERRPLEEIVFQLSPTKHLVFSPEPLTTRINCRNGTHQPLFLSAGNNRIEISQGCWAELNSHIISSDFDIRVSPDPLEYAWHWDPMHLSASLLQDAHHMDQVIDQLHTDMKHLQNTSIQAGKLHEHLEEHLANPMIYPSSWWIVLGVIAGILMVILLTFFCYKCGWCDTWESAYYNIFPEPRHGVCSKPDRDYPAVMVPLKPIPLGLQDRDCAHGKVASQCCGIPN